MASVSISKPSKVLGGHNMLILGLIREELKCDTFQIKLILHICSSCKHKSVTLFPWIFYRHLDLSSWWTVPRSDDVPYTHCLVNIETCEITTTISILFPTISNHCRSPFRWSCWLVGRKTTVTKITTHYTTERCDAWQGAVRCARGFRMSFSIYNVTALLRPQAVVCRWFPGGGKPVALNRRHKQRRGLWERTGSVKSVEIMFRSILSVLL